MRSFSTGWTDNPQGNEVIHHACWSGLRSMSESRKEIFIYDYRYPETEQYISLLVKIINKITPCEIVNVKGKEYIKYTLIFPYYDQNLILLSFIRNLWYQVKEGYAKAFFEKLSTATYIDPLKKLLISNKVACEKLKLMTMGGRNHNNVADYDKLVLKDKSALLNWKIESTTSMTNTLNFLTKL